jgi:hypothetical protein
MVNGARIISRSIRSPKPRSSVSTFPKEGERSCVDTNARHQTPHPAACASDLPAPRGGEDVSTPMPGGEVKHA